VLAIIAAKMGAGRVFATDASAGTIEVGRSNADALEVANAITFLEGDLFDPIPEEVTADVVIGDVSGIPDTIAAESGWFPTRVGGGPSGSELPIRMLQDAVRRLRPGGRLFLPTGTLQDEAAILDAARSLYARLRQVTDRIIPLPNVIAESKKMRDLIDAGVVKLIPRGSRFVWETRVWEIT
jgi:release factor glutamine methyltransferase